MAKNHGIEAAIEDSAEKLQGRVGEARDRFEDAAKRIKEKGEETWEHAVQYAQKHPGKALGFALLIGAALGALWATSRRRD